jgi:hypothetical protein
MRPRGGIGRLFHGQRTPRATAATCKPRAGYTKLDASVALGGGMGGLRLKNENGVIMTLHSRTQGLDLNLGSVTGVTVTME